MTRLLLSLIFLSSTVLAQTTITLSPSQDNTLYESASGSLSNGAGDHLFFGATNGDDLRRALIQFDLSQIPSNASITSATLTVFISRENIGPAPATVHEVLESWGEGTSNAPGQEGGGATPTTGDATWIHRFHDTQDWTDAGGTYGPALVTQQTSSGSVSFSSAGIDALVGDWVSGTKANNGIIIIGDEGTTASAKRIESRENSSNSPELEVTYTVSTGLDLSSNADFSIHPNPVNGSFQIQGLEEIQSIELLSLNGSKVQDFNLAENRFDVSNLQSGIYILRVEGAGYAVAKKLVIN